MSKKPRYFVLIAHCLLNPRTRVSVLGKRFSLSKKIVDYFLDKNISIIQLPCPEFTAMGYCRNPQGRQQYDNVFFRKHCRKELESYVDMVEELKENSNTPLCFIGIQGSPTCSIYWGKHKINKYKTESIMSDPSSLEEEDEEVISQHHKCTCHDEDYVQCCEGYGVMSQVLHEMLEEKGIKIPFFEAPMKEDVHSKRSTAFFNALYDVLDIPEKYRDITEFTD